MTRDGKFRKSGGSLTFEWEIEKCRKGDGICDEVQSS